MAIYVFLGGSDPKVCPLEDGSCCSISIVGGDVCVLQEDTLKLNSELVPTPLSLQFNQDRFNSVPPLFSGICHALQLAT